ATITDSSAIAGTYAPPAVHEPSTAASCGMPAALMRAWLAKMRPKWCASGNTSSWRSRFAPPESTRYRQGSRFSSAICWARRCFFTVMGKYAPPLTVASLLTTITCRPATRPMPATMPAPGHSSSYMPHAASGATSRNGLPSSSSSSTRCRGSSLPRARWRSRDRSGPPRAVRASRSRSSATRARWLSALVRYASLAGSTALVSVVIVVIDAPHPRGSPAAGKDGTDPCGPPPSEDAAGGAPRGVVVERHVPPHVGGERTGGGRVDRQAALRAVAVARGRAGRERRAGRAAGGAGGDLVDPQVRLDRAGGVVAEARRRVGPRPRDARGAGPGRRGAVAAGRDGRPRPAAGDHAGVEPAAPLLALDHGDGQVRGGADRRVQLGVDDLGHLDVDQPAALLRRDRGPVGSLDLGDGVVGRLVPLGGTDLVGTRARARGSGRDPEHQEPEHTDARRHPTNDTSRHPTLIHHGRHPFPAT